MFVVLDTEEIIPCRYDQGRDLYVIDKFEMDDDDVENIVAIVSDNEHFPVRSVEVIETTRRVYFVDVEFEDDELNESDDGDTSDEDYTDSEELYESSSEGESSEGDFEYSEADDTLLHAYGGMPKYLFEPEY